MSSGLSNTLVRYLENAFPGTRVYESTRGTEPQPLVRCFRIDDESYTHLLIVASRLLAVRSGIRLSELLDGSDLAECLSRAEGLPVLLTENGWGIVE